MTAALPPGLLLSWYGDDFTGSAAVMEVLTFSGVPSVLFLDTPTPERLRRFPEARAIGIAGVARAHTPDWMDQHLPPILDSLVTLNAPLCHYKVCSTFDSSPEIGSIGHAIDLALPRLGGLWAPLLVAAPPIGRYQAFGNLFAAATGSIHRLDRHPVMARHPVTPMLEADIGRHLAHQTDQSIGLIDVLALRADGGRAALTDQLRAGSNIVLLDAIDEEDMARAGQLIWEHRGERLLAVGSQGIEYALAAYWRSIGALPATTQTSGVGRVSQIFAVSGSVSETTARQIAWAEQNGFSLISFDPVAVLDPAASLREQQRAVFEALRALGQGHSVLVHTARGPDDSAVRRFREAASQTHQSIGEASGRIGNALGHVLREVLRESRLSRAVISGGDTSGLASAALDLVAVTALAPTIPGASLLKAHSDDPAFSTLELALKGGQMGSTDYFGWIRDGGGAR